MPRFCFRHFVRFQFPCSERAHKIEDKLRFRVLRLKLVLMRLGFQTVDVKDREHWGKWLAVWIKPH